MTQSQPRRRGTGRSLLRLLSLILIVGAAYLGVVCLAIVHEASLQQTQPAEAIVVFGAAEYDGRPSPVFRARLDHAFDLFQRGVAPVVITTGGAGADPRYSEGGVGHDYLMHRGIPEARLIAETLGSDTALSATRVGVILRTNHMMSCVAVSDQYHVFRIRKLLAHEGVKVQVAPRPNSRPKSSLQRMMAVLREAVSYALWRLDIPT
jgi:uncharacterized SAM-binding protein YcdF (DUF218 family)